MPFSIGRVAAGALVVMMLAVVLAACSQQAEPQTTAATADTPAPTAAAPAAPTAAPTSAPAPTATPEPAPTATAEPRASATQPAATAAPASTATEAPVTTPAATAASSGSGANHFVLGEGTVARYRIDEELAGRGFFTAVGETTEVVGRVVFDDDGGVVAEGSTIVMQAASLTTDSDRRDGYVRERTLLTSEYPAIVFSPTSAEGLPSPLSDASGTVEFTITGDLTVRDQTREVTWDVVAEFGDTISGLASVVVTFEQFGIDKPSVAVVLSVEDSFQLELEFVGAFEEAGAINVDSADNTAYAQFLGDDNAPVTVIEFSDFQ
ncbi:MAG: YceI family protein [Chloroflexi bacterium]|nr:YceI family protein [Chloroflexota bacterium]